LGKIGSARACSSQPAGAAINQRNLLNQITQAIAMTMMAAQSGRMKIEFSTMEHEMLYEQRARLLVLRTYRNPANYLAVLVGHGDQARVSAV
jgi:hypothetical protein